MAEKTTARDMTDGPILKQLILFAAPLLLGNAFQLLYNTVDSLVVGNFVGTEALAAVGSTTMIINMLVLFFNGLATGAGVLIAQAYGAKDIARLHRAIETTMLLTFICCVLLSVIGVRCTPYMLRFMSTPDDVMEPAAEYLKIYFSGLSGLLIYNMGSGILRAVGDTTRPLLFLMVTSVVNTILDLVFVLVFDAGIKGVGFATIIAQFISAVLILVLMTRTRDIYRLKWTDLSLDKNSLKKILVYGLPAAIQSVITAFSNVFVQAYINIFGSACIAGWSCYNKLDAFIFLPMQSMAMASTTFVSQNVGAKKMKRADRGTWTALGMMVSLSLILAVILWVFASPVTAIFTDDENVIAFGVLFMRTNIFFLCFNAVNHVLAGGLRGRGDSTGPMVIMLSTFVVVRQCYLYAVTHFIANTPRIVGFGYPVGWICCCTAELFYFYIRYIRNRGAADGS